MYAAAVEPAWDAHAWRRVARAALCAGVPPERLDWSDQAGGGLLAATPVETLAAHRPVPAVPRAFLGLAAQVLAHRDPIRHALLYRLLWRIVHDQPRLLERAVDDDVRRAEMLARAVRRDLHKMKAFVRFRALPGDEERFLAWFEPEHHVVDLAAPFFARRFAGMRWAILTPYRSVAWDGQRLAFGGGGTRADAPAEDAREDLWRTYYAHIFNPARLNTRAMRQEMPQKYWRHLPEARLLPDLEREAGRRVREMAERDARAPRKPRLVARAAPRAAPAADGSLDALRAEAAACRACPLWRPATQTVFGEGSPDARLMIVGEQPGDEEDLRGRPFVGPAGGLLDRALAELGLDRGRCYVTNAVKHFKFEQRGKARLHRNPAAAERRACRPWLAQERARIRPARIACLGATAAEAVLGPGFRLMQERGRWHALADGSAAMATVHPAWILRQRTPEAREQAWRGFVDDLALLVEPAAAGD